MVVNTIIQETTDNGIHKPKEKAEHKRNCSEYRSIHCI